MAESGREKRIDLVRAQVALGPRVPGSEAHRKAHAMISSRIGGSSAKGFLQRFHASFHGVRVECANLIAHLPATGNGGGNAVLLGTHYDTRPRADRESNPEKRELPIPGANDGGSGTAVLLRLLDLLGARDRKRDIVLAFFDAEDLGDIDGNPFALGAEYFAAYPLPGLPEIGEVVVLDMVGGKGMVFDMDAHIIHHEHSKRLTEEVFAAGAALKAGPFVKEKRGRLKYIVSDQWPFLRRGIPSCILIDIDYPEWHTHGDLPEAMSEESLEVTEEALLLFLSRSPG
jgi:glutaminyl-peptide cyclotransferase